MWAVLVQAAAWYSLMSPPRIGRRRILSSAPARASRSRRRRGLVGGGSGGAMRVVVLDVVVEERPELVFVPDQGVVQQFVPDGAHEPFRDRVRKGCAGRGPDHIDAFGRNTASNWSTKVGARSRMRNRNRSSVAVMARFRATWVHHGEHRAIGVGELGPGRLAAQDLDLVA